MVTSTVFPGLVSIDPIQGLIDYVQDIKPYHTKIFETLVEYVYTDFVNVSIVDVNVLDTNLLQQDALNPTVIENNGTDTSVPTSITEAFDFFVTAPALAPTQTIVDVSTTNNTVSFTGNVSLFPTTLIPLVFGLNYVRRGDILTITGSSGNNGTYDVLSVGYNSGTNQTIVTLNTLPSSTSGGSATFFQTDTTYNFQLAIQSVANPGPTIIDPATAGTSGQISFTTPIFVISGNVTRAIQAGSIFRVKGTSSNDGIYHAVYVNFTPGIAASGKRTSATDTTTIGVGIPVGAPDGNPFFPVSSIISSGVGGNIIPYNITGYDKRFDAPFDRMAGYEIVSS